MAQVQNTAARRAYEEIKRRILDGRLPVRSRIDVEIIAREQGISSMPVRQALSLLTWERLVRPGRHSAYEVALWSETELRDLYAWRGALLGFSLPIAASAIELKRIARTRPYPASVFEAMRVIEASANPELRRAAINADERLWVAREVEGDVLGDVEAEFATLMDALSDRSKRATILLRSYTRRRVERAGALRAAAALRALPNNGQHG